MNRTVDDSTIAYFLSIPRSAFVGKVSMSLSAMELNSRRELI